MRWGDYPVLSRLTLRASTGVLIRWRQSEMSDRSGVGNVALEAEIGVIGPHTKGSSRSWKRQGTDSLLKSPEGTQL